MTKARLVVVEDEVIIARDIQHTLKRLGYEVLALSTTGEDALKRVAETQPDVVLMDIRLSGEMDGVATAEIIRTRDKLPVVYLTAHSDEATLRRAQVTEPYGYVLKPFEERELVIAIDIALYRHTVEMQLRRMERWLATTLDSIGDAVIAADTAGSVTYMNRVAEALTGWPLAEAMGRPLEKVLQLIHSEPPHAPIESLVARVLREGMIIELNPNTMLLNRAGNMVPVDDSAAPIRDEAEQVLGVVIICRDVSARHRAEAQLRHSASHDALTGLPNRVLLMDRLSYAFEHARRHPGYHFALLYLDLDRFKVINDSLGHLFGDQVLIQAAQRLAKSLRLEDMIARLGGDEFVILLDGVSDLRDAVHIAERIQDSLREGIKVKDQVVFTTVSIGVVLSQADYKEPDEILRDADTALYQAKAQGKARYHIFDTALHQRALKLLRLETDLRYALEREEFRIFYQPIVELKSGQLRGFEALIRWQHPERGLLTPDEFLGLAEETGLIVPLGWWTFRQACHQAARWQKHGDLSISVNVSNRQFLQPDLLPQINQILTETGLSPHQFCLEITETVILDENGFDILSKLKAIGVQLHLDDFGTGYSSLSLIHRAPIDMLKIDQHFIQTLTDETGEKSSTVRTILLLAQELGLHVVAEGIQTAAQATFLKALACEHGQGYLFSKPIDAATATALIQENRRLPPE